jgi:hypothetical protein
VKCSREEGFLQTHVHIFHRLFDKTLFQTWTRRISVLEVLTQLNRVWILEIGSREGEQAEEGYIHCLRQVFVALTHSYDTPVILWGQNTQDIVRSAFSFMVVTQPLRQDCM